MRKTASTIREYNEVRQLIEEFDKKCSQLYDLIKTTYPSNLLPGETLVADVSVGDGNYILDILHRKVKNAVDQALKEYAYARYLFDKTNN